LSPIPNLETIVLEKARRKKALNCTYFLGVVGLPAQQKKLREKKKKG